MTTTIRITARRDEGDSGATEQRGVLLRRIAVAGLLIALLIGGLAVFDASRRTADDDEEVLPPAAAPAAAPAAPEPAAQPAVPPEETPAVGPQNAHLQDTPPPLPEGDAATPAPATEAAPAAARAGRPGATPEAAVAPPSASRSSAVVSEPAVPESTARPGAPAASAAPASPTDAPRAADRPARTEPAAPAPPALTRSPAGGYVVQAGVFSHTANAEELRAKLALHGIPAQIEARVLVGPFRTRAEADRARAQMRALGLEGAPPVAR